MTAKGCTMMEWQLRAALQRVAAMGCPAMGWRLRAALQGWQPRAALQWGCSRWVCTAMGWQPRAALCCRGGSRGAALHRWQRGLHRFAMVAAEGLHCTGGSCGLRCAVVVAAEGCAMLQCWQLKAVAGVVSAKGLHCNGGSRGDALHRWQPRAALCCSGGC